MPTPVTRYTEIEYADLELKAPYKSEYFNGEIFAMAGGTMPHSEIKLAILSLLRAGVNRQRCRVLDSDFRIRVAATGLQTYPDGSVVCGAPQFGLGRRDCLENPTVIVEVLSESTQAYDRGEKFEHYKRIPSLREHALAWQTRPRVEVFRLQPDGTWTASTFDGEESAVSLESIGVTLRVGDIYAGIELTGGW